MVVYGGATNRVERADNRLTTWLRGDDSIDRDAGPGTLYVWLSDRLRRWAELNGCGKAEGYNINVFGRYV
jgi:hypothetical protein